MLRTLLLFIALSPIVVHAQNFPKLKSGLWEMTTTNTRNKDRPPLKSSICLDASLQQEMIRMSTGMMQGMCSKFDTKYVGNKFTGEATCNLGASTMRSRSRRRCKPPPRWPSSAPASSAARSRPAHASSAST